MLDKTLADTVLAFGQEAAMSFGLYLFGFLVLLSGLVYAAMLMHIPTHWIAVLVLIVAGLGIVKAVRATRPKDSA
ncbi:MAG: hypothetical protein WDO73_24385 [Ignavibacteriota bacterium]